MRPTAEAFAEVLLARHKQLCLEFSAPVNEAAIKASRISYGDLCKLARAGTAVGAGAFLVEVHERCEKQGFPPLNSLVVNKKTGKPGENYPGGLRNWPKHVRECIAFKNYPLSL
jgi:hypothetical protein